MFIQVIVIAVVLALIFKKTSQDDEEDTILQEDEELVSYDSKKDCGAVGSARYIVPSKIVSNPLTGIFLSVACLCTYSHFQNLF